MGKLLTSELIAQITVERDGVLFCGRSIDLTQRQMAVFAALLLAARARAGLTGTDELMQLTGLKRFTVTRAVHSLRVRLWRLNLDVAGQMGPGGGYRLVLRDDPAPSPGALAAMLALAVLANTVVIGGHLL